MKSLISKDGKWVAERISNYDVQVSNVKTFTNYTIMANVKTGSTGGCTCSYGKRAGAICPHIKLVKEFGAMEQAPVVVEVWCPLGAVDTLKKWLDEQAEQGIQIFA